MSESFPVIKGTLDTMVLKALNDGPMHGFEIAHWLDRHSSGQLEITDSALYQALYRMEGKGLILAGWGVTENNRKARYYELLKAGSAHLEKEIRNWVQYSEMVTGILLERDGSARSKS